MKSYLFIVLFALMLVPVLAAAEDCTVSCGSLGYNCGFWTICGATVDCGHCGGSVSCEAGVCQDKCVSHDEKRCYGGDVYWYNSCGQRESKYEYCDIDCHNGRCIYNQYDDSRYYNYYYWPHNRCDPVCSYASICSQAANDGCGNVCHRITEGLSCGSNGECRNGACVYPPQPAEQPQVRVEGLQTYSYPMPTQVISYVPQARENPGDMLVVVLLVLGCILLLFMVFFILMRLMK